VHWANQAESLSNYYHKLRKAKLAVGVSLLISASTLICAWPPGVFLISSIRQLATEICAVNISCAFRDTLHISLTISYPRSINQHFKLAYKNVEPILGPAQDKINSDAQIKDQHPF
jgi:hypothetical protein